MHMASFTLHAHACTFYYSAILYEDVRSSVSENRVDDSADDVSVEHRLACHYD